MAKQQENQMSNNCQSCGMPLKKDVQHGGSNSDGSKSDKYCSLCYENGQFTQADFNVAEMQKFCMEKMKECGVPRPLGWLFTIGLPKLERWSS